MKTETKHYLTKYITDKISKIKKSQDELAKNASDFTTSGPIRSERSELDQLRLNRQLNEASLNDLKQIQQALPTAPINLSKTTDWAEVELNYIADSFKEIILLVPNEISGAITPEILMVSPDSPLGQSIQGHKIGDNVSFKVGDKDIDFEILSIN